MRGIATTACPGCGGPLAWVAQHSQWWCAKERKYYPPGPSPAAVTTSTAGSAQAAVSAMAQAVPALWTQNSYRIRKKVLALTGQYWIEDQAGNHLG